MKTKIEFGKIRPVVHGIGFYRVVLILETDNVLDGQIVVSSTIFGETKEELEVIDFENFQEAEDATRELIINIEQDVEKCIQCGKLCMKDPKYPTSTQIKTSFGYFCCWGCIETYAVENQKTIVSFFENIL